MGNSKPAIADISVVDVRKTTAAYSTGIVGVVDKAVSVPSAEVKAAYQNQRRRQEAELAQQEQLRAKGGDENLAAADAIQIPEITINAKDAFMQEMDKSSGIANGDYCNGVTLGSFKAIKVDAAYGAIHAGDLLVSSPHAGYAMKANQNQTGVGRVIGKALGPLNSGTGTIPVMVTAK